MDVYRIGTLMELVRTLALSFADDGKSVKSLRGKVPLLEYHCSLLGLDMPLVIFL
ncbi:putative adenylate kinase [Rosa chinensis]|uniref:Putative adenylate kinase n=1 Tax=Rosa chinensis TaxID=74649 RepID=A0A2P6P460_ROSCH|nr:putative adenylate kinase [Rosa chinensis]